jgi:hypothetical protein
VKLSPMREQCGHGVIPVVYIAGTSCCGSTLLSFLLNMHPDLLCIGEMGPARQFEVESYECSCGAVLAECPFFLQVKAHMDEQGVAFDMNRWELRHRYSANRTLDRLVMGALGTRVLGSIRSPLLALVPRYTARMRAFERRNVAFIRAALAVSGASVFLDATKIPSRIRFLAGIEEIGLRVIHLLRDPRGYCSSARKHWGRSVELASREWASNQDYCEDARRELPEVRWLRTRYEDFCTDPDKHLAELCDFMGVPHLPAPEEYRSTAHHIIGNRMRSSSDPRTSIRLDEKWRETLSESEQRIVARVAGNQARRYGYDI